jgi:hypothetical protein
MSSYGQSVIDDVAQGATQKIVAITYASAILATAQHLEEVDWTPVNRAILDRWSHGALDRIKRAAWKLAKAPASGDPPPRA